MGVRLPPFGTITAKLALKDIELKITRGRTGLPDSTKKIDDEAVIRNSESEERRSG